MITAEYKGIDGWNHATFKGNDGNFYCLVDKLFSHYETPKPEDVAGHPVYVKGRNFEGEPSHYVPGVLLTFPGGQVAEVRPEIFTVEALQEGRFMSCVWPEEGSFDERGNWSFNKEHTGFEPLAIDAQSGKVFLLVYDALNNSNRAKMKEKAEDNRGYFGQFVAFAWERVSFGRG